MIIVECEQRTDAWRAIRLGKITASNADRLLTAPKRASYAQELIVELFATEQEEMYVNAAMQHGIDYESEAAAWYEAKTQRTVTPVGFVIHDDHPNYACSPDGLVGEDGLIEIKCPGSRAHIEHLDNGPGSKYNAQMQWQLFITGRSWCDFVSYSPRFDGELRGSIQRVYRDEIYIGKLKAGAEKVMSKMDSFKSKMFKPF